MCNIFGDLPSNVSGVFIEIQHHILIFFSCFSGFFSQDMFVSVYLHRVLALFDGIVTGIRHTQEPAYILHSNTVLKLPSNIFLSDAKIYL